MEAPGDKEQKFMTVDFTMILMKWGWIAYVVVGIVAVCILLVSDQYTRSAVRQEGLLSAQAIENTAKLRGEFEAYVKRADIERAEMKAEIGRKTR